MEINWNYPEPRPGIKGIFDRFFGPGMTRLEIFINFTENPVQIGQSPYPGIQVFWPWYDKAGNIHKFYRAHYPVLPDHSPGISPGN